MPPFLVLQRFCLEVSHQAKRPPTVEDYDTKHVYFAVRFTTKVTWAGNKREGHGASVNTYDCPYAIFNPNVARQRGRDPTIPGNIIKVQHFRFGRTGNRFMAMYRNLALGYCCKSKLVRASKRKCSPCSRSRAVISSQRIVFRGGGGGGQDISSPTSVQLAPTDVPNAGAHCSPLGTRLLQVWFPRKDEVFAPGFLNEGNPGPRGFDFSNAPDMEGFDSSTCTKSITWKDGKAMKMTPREWRAHAPRGNNTRLAHARLQCSVVVLFGGVCCSFPSTGCPTALTLLTPSKLKPPSVSSKRPGASQVRAETQGLHKAGTATYRV